MSTLVCYNYGNSKTPALYVLIQILYKYYNSINVNHPETID